MPENTNAPVITSRLFASSFASLDFGVVSRKSEPDAWS